MEITFHPEGAPALRCRQPYADADHVVGPDGSTCAECAEGPVKVHCEQSTEGHDTIEGPALCVYCGKLVGRLVVKVSTIFGIEEDRRVLCGRWRVYG